VLDLEVDELVRWRRLTRDRLLEAVLRGRGTMLLSPSELARLFPDLWPSRNAAKLDLRRKGGSGSYKIFYLSRCLRACFIMLVLDEAV